MIYFGIRSICLRSTCLIYRKTLMLSITGFMRMIAQQMPARPNPWSLLPRKILILTCSSWWTTKPSKELAVLNSLVSGSAITFPGSWNNHIDHICKKARKTIGFLHRSFHRAPPQTRSSIPSFPLPGPCPWIWLHHLPPTINSKLTARLEATQRFANVV